MNRLGFGDSHTWTPERRMRFWDELGVKWCRPCGQYTMSFHPDGRCLWCDMHPDDDVRLARDKRGNLIRLHGRGGYNRGCRGDVFRGAARAYNRGYKRVVRAGEGFVPKKKRGRHDPSAARCEATKVRDGKRCRFDGSYDPVAGGIRCSHHEARLHEAS